MKTVTLEQFIAFKPCWLEEEGGRERLENIASRHKEWTDLDVLELSPEEVSSEDKLWAVLRPEYLQEETLHEFACRCAERALSFVDNPDPRSIAAIEAKRKWLRGEIADEDRFAAWSAAVDAAGSAAASAAWSAVRDAASAAWSAAWANASAAAWSAAWAAASAAARDAAEAAARDAERDLQVQMLIELIKEETE